MELLFGVVLLLCGLIAIVKGAYVQPRTVSGLDISSAAFHVAACWCCGVVLILISLLVLCPLVGFK